LGENDLNQSTLKTRSGKELPVQRLGAGHAEALPKFHAALSSASRDSFTPHAYDPETVAVYIRRSEADEDRIYVALSDAGIVGYFFLWAFQEAIPLLGIGLADAFQSEGLGAQMMAILIDDAKAAARDGIELTTMQHNDRAFALYRKMGFEHVGDVDNVTGDGRHVVERKMFLALKDGAQPSTREFKPPV
jgi:ribosomal protein S18 acetylase RimI-like enzyme